MDLLVGQRLALLLGALRAVFSLRLSLGARRTFLCGFIGLRRFLPPLRLRTIRVAGRQRGLLCGVQQLRVLSERSNILDLELIHRRPFGTLFPHRHRPHLFSCRAELISLPPG
jgi:hypothetical protein